MKAPTTLWQLSRGWFLRKVNVPQISGGGFSCTRDTEQRTIWATKKWASCAASVQQDILSCESLVEQEGLFVFKTLKQQNIRLRRIVWEVESVDGLEFQEKKPTATDGMTSSSGSGNPQKRVGVGSSRGEPRTGAPWTFSSPVHFRALEWVNDLG